MKEEVRQNISISLNIVQFVEHKQRGLLIPEYF